MSYQVLSDVDKIGEDKLESMVAGTGGKWKWYKYVALSVVALLLGHASIAHAVSPFGLAFFIVFMEMGGKRHSWPGYLILAGSYWGGGIGAAAITGVEIALYLLLRKLVFRGRAADIHWLPFIGALVDMACRLAAVGSVWTRYDVLLAAADGALVIILALIFVQCMPLFVGREPSRDLKQEQLISLTILVGSMIAGLAGLQPYGVSLVAVCADVIVLLMASAGGPGVGASVAVVVGILSMLNHSATIAMVAILCFAGLLGGILKDAGRLWLGLAFLLSVAMLTVGTGTGLGSLESTMLAAGIATVLFWMSPPSIKRSLATYVPGTVEHHLSEQERVRRVRALVSERIKDMSQVFEELSATFEDTGESPLTSTQQLLNHIVGSAAQNVCAACPRRVKCWDKESFATYQAIVHSTERIEANPGIPVSPSHDLKERCIRVDSMMGVLRHNLEVTERDARWIEKIHEQRTLVSAQLSGVASLIDSLATEFDKGTEDSLAGEEQILSALEKLGLFVDHVHIVSLDPGKVEVEISQPSAGAYENSVRMIAPLLSGIVGENISVSKVIGDDGGPCKSVFTSARVYDVETAVATVARDGRLVSGDSHTAVDLGNGRFAVALSDGMGNGERAQRESKAAIELLKRLLKAGFEEQLAIKTVNSALLLRSHDEMFTTLDMALVDLYSAQTAFLKIGSAPSFVKRGGEVRAVSGDNVPIGILQDIEVQSIHEQLQEGDLLILMSDGIYDAPVQVYDKEEWLHHQIEQLETNDPQSIADTLLENAVKMAGGEIPDDMTVMVARIQRHQPEWAAIKLPGVVGLRAQDRRRRGA